MDNVWQYVHIGAAAFLFYEDHLLCLYSLLGFVSLCGDLARAAGTTNRDMQSEQLWI